MAFESNAAWQFAVRKVAANRDLLMAVAGVFFVLPSFALNLYTPDFPASMDPAARYDQMMKFSSSVTPFLFLLFFVEGIGATAILALMSDRDRPTVGDALRSGLRNAFACFGAFLVLFGGAVIGLSVMLIIGAASGVAAIAAVAISAGIVIAVWILTRFSLVAPVIQSEGLRNPFAALGRSWRLTRGNAGRLLVFYLLLMLAFLIVLSLIMLLVGVILAITVSAETGKIVADLVASMLTGVVALYLIGAIAGAHRQLAGAPEA